MEDDTQTQDATSGVETVSSNPILHDVQIPETN